ncbi:cell wall-binding repeat-containing protein [Mesobacillus selenatarsenatis]|uniref:N-acetylmuramoyl-L-alanine amidase n=1 Tax=Mesobacillus selenatarsenatis (strain DSM 18680 / JCM 14380 / FERM P-15431 / SF-1) TaxID=1321606 RepID=A0A0A8X053_MESS1|nr:cell wall-binding repeat-containing protein [Mesobacillus selenatarsenatis]GAM12624.1 N-acetylmuramoyl-L-alanine amidase [Mesobacillus selenatarsenatis SF-1]
MSFVKKLLLLAASFLIATSPFVDHAFAEESSSKTLERESKINHLFSQNSQSGNEPTYQMQFYNEPVADTVNYQDVIDAYHIHEYRFGTSGGKFTVEFAENDDIEYLIYDVNLQEIIEEESENTFDLIPGYYAFVIMGFSDVPVEYEYNLNGPFSLVPDNTLPELEVTNWKSNEFRLPKGSSPVYPVEGYFKGYTLELSVNSERFFISNGGKFLWENVVFGKGFNEVTFEAYNINGNSVTEFYYITLPGVSRIYGQDRYRVSSGVYSSLEYWEYGSNTVIISRGDMYPDALSGGPLATLETAPILLTPTNKLSDRVVMTLEHYQPEKAIILGGTVSVSPEVERQLKRLGINDIERIGGKDRYAVSASIAERVSEYTGSDTAIIASGEAFPDALSASSIAGPMGMPILLVQPGKVPDSIQTFINNHPEITNFIIVGGPVAVKENVATQLKQLRSGAVIKRINGKDRYEVSINVAKFGMENYGMDLSTITFVRGDLFPDALSGAPLANYFGSPIILTTTDKLESKVYNFLSSNKGKTEHMYIIGDVLSVSPYVEQQLNTFIR